MLPVEKIKLIESCMMKAAFDMLSDHDIVEEFKRLANEELRGFVSRPPQEDLKWEQSLLNFKVRRSSQLDGISRVIISYNGIYLCSFDCDYSDERYGCIIRYKTIEKDSEFGISVLYYEGKSDTDMFEYSGDGLNTELVFKPIVNLIRNTINYQLYQQIPRINGTEESNGKEENENMTDETKLDCLCTKPQFNDWVLKPGDVIAVTSHAQNTADVRIPFVTMGIAGYISGAFDRALGAGENIIGTIVQVEPDGLYLFGAWGRNDRRTGIFHIKPEQVSSGDLTISGVLLLKGDKDHE